MRLYFQILLIALTAAYLVFESIYNFDMLNAASQSASKALKQTLEELEIRGHKVSSIGLTLFLVPFFYTVANFIFKKKFKWHEIAIFSLVLAFSIFSYKSIYISLEKLMDYIVAKNQDRRFEAYYINSLKYNIIDGNFGFESFLDKQTAGNIANSVYAKTLISNIFLLTFLDENLSDKVKANSYNIADELYLNSEDVRLKRNEDRIFFIQKADEIKNGYDEYCDTRKRINTGFSGINDGQKEYQKFTQEIDNKYANYLKNSNQYMAERKRQLGKVDSYYDDLSRYFRHQRLGEKKYKQSMQTNFGHYINPQSWCYKGTCPHKEAIASTIDKEMKSKWNKKSGGIAPNLSQMEFLKNPNVKNEVVANLRKKGLMVDKSFNYSRVQFLKAYNDAFASGYEAKVGEFQKEFEKKTGIKNVDMNLDYSGFVRLFYPQFLEKFENSSTNANKAVNLIINGNLDDFDDEIFNPMALQKFDKTQYIFTKDEFYNDKRAIEYGDKALKSLYIPPFAISLSIISGVLNLINLLSMVILLLYFGKHKNLARVGVKIGLICAVCVLIAIFSPKYLKDNVAINKLKSQKNAFNSYLYLLDSVIWLENFNYNLNSKYLIRNKTNL